MKKIRWLLKLLFAINALSFAFLLGSYVIVLFITDPRQASSVWEGPYYYMAAWLVSTVICLKYMRDH